MKSQNSCHLHFPKGEISDTAEKLLGLMATGLVFFRDVASERLTILQQIDGPIPMQTEAALINSARLTFF